MRRCGLLLAALLTVGARTVAAQTAPDGGPDPSLVRVRIGPLWMNPTFALTNLGFDDNVFNEPTDAPPKKDFTLTLSPQAEIWMPLGRTWLSGNLREDIVWFKQYASERTANTSYGVGWRAPLSRIAFLTTANWTSARERPGFEIDARLQRQESRYGAIVDVRALSRTFIEVNGSWSKTEFDSNAIFLGSNLNDQLTRRGFVVGLSVRHQLTPLTSIALGVSRAEDRFEFSPLRDTNSMIYTTSVTFAPDALIRGTVTVGFRDFAPRSATIPGYTGSMAAVDLSYTLFGSTRFGGQIARDVQYSYDVSQPYYVSTGINASVAQQIFGPLDAVARIGWQGLDYRNRAGAVVAVSDRSDTIRSYGGGVGYRLGSSMRLGFNIDKQIRNSALLDRRYEGLRYGTSITYGR